MVVVATALAEVASAQGGISARTAVLYEQYQVDSLFIFSKVSEITVPLVVTVPFGQRGSFTLSGGMASVSLTSADPGQLADQSVSGLLDTQFRVAFTAVPGRLVVIASGTIPTGKKSLSQDQLFVLGPLASDVIGFSAGQLGSGGSVAGGLAGAFPLGRFALGAGATYTKPLSYVPVLGRSDELLPGAEFRGRLGLEGPLGRRTYLRLAGIYAVRQKDAINDSTQNGLGNRVIGYLAVNQGFGGASLTLYGFDVFRSDPQIEPTAVGAALLPRGNLLALGFQFAYPLGSSITLTPRGEYRLSAAAADTVDATLRRAGTTMRLGADLAYRASRSTRFVLLGSGLFGNAVQAGSDVGLTGVRVGLVVELTP
jgi:hypothetical protein